MTLFLTKTGTYVVKSYEFFRSLGVDDWANSRSGFNPLQQDFGNASLYSEIYEYIHMVEYTFYILHHLLPIYLR